VIAPSLVAVTDAGNDELADVFTGVTARDWLVAATILLAAILVSRVVKAVTARMVQGDDGSGRVAAQLVGRIVGLIVLVGGFVYALSSLGVTPGPLLGALGLGGLALAFAAQSVLENTFASILLQARRPFRRGDQIATGEIEGIVEDVNFRTVNIRTYAGEKVLVPCSEVLNNPIVNYTDRGYRRSDLSVGVDYATDLRLAQDLLLRAASSVPEVRSRPEPEAWVEGFGESSIDFSLRFWHAPDQANMWRVRSAVAMAVKATFDRAGVTIPFPQRTIGFLPGAERVEVAMPAADGAEAGKEGPQEPGPRLEPTEGRRGQQ
jgi:small conductance mechanosensitive channel